jgi:hypothetical protein
MKSFFPNALSSGLDLSTFEGWLAQPEAANTEVVRWTPSESTHTDRPDSVGNPPVGEASTTAPETATKMPKSRLEAPRGKPTELSMASPQRLRKATALMKTPPAASVRAAASSVFAPPQSPRREAVPPVDFTNVRISSGVDAPLHATVLRGDAQIRPANNLRFERRECDGGGSKGPLWNNYFGTPGDDENFAIASGKAAFTGDSYAVGHAGPIGTIQQYAVGGGCLALFTVTSGTGAPVEIRDVATNSMGVYVAGTVGAGTDAFVVLLSPTLVPIMSVGIPAPAGGSINLNGVGISPNGVLPNVYVTGQTFNPALAPFDLTRVISFTPGLGAVVYDSLISFGSASTGRSIDADRPQNAYVAGIISLGAIPNIPFQFRLNAGGAAIPWAFTTTAGAPVVNADNGMNGVRFIGGTTSALGVYFTGTVQDAVVNPGSDDQLLLKRAPATGAIIYSTVISIAGIDLGGQANAVDRAGDQFTAGFVGAPAPRDAVFLHYGPTGLGPLDAIPVGTAAGFFDQGNGIDLRTTAPGDDVFGAGLTTTPTAAMFPPPGPCDPTYNGLDDGFAARFFQPL